MRGRAFAALGPEPLGPELTARASASARSPAASGDQAAAARPAASSPGSATSTSARRCSARGSIRARRRARSRLRRAGAAGAGDPRRARANRSPTAARPCATIARPDGELGYFATPIRGLWPRGRGVPARGRRHGQAHRPGRAQHLVLPAAARSDGAMLDDSGALPLRARAFPAGPPAVYPHDNPRTPDFRPPRRGPTRGQTWPIRRKPRSASAATTNRAEINGARMSRIRSFVKKVESAIAGGDKTGRCRSAQGRAARTGPRRRPRGAPQEHRQRAR